MKKLSMLVAVLSLMLIGIGSVSAEEYSITVEAETGEVGAQFEMYLNGAEEKEGIEYFVKFVNENDEKPDASEIVKCWKDGTYDRTVNNCVYVAHSKNLETGEVKYEISIDRDWYMLKGYTKAYVYKCQLNESYERVCEGVGNYIEVEKPELPGITQRYKNYLFTDDKNSLSVFPLFPVYGTTGSHEINVKIGKIENKELLRKLAKKENGSYSELLKYAVADAGKTFTAKDENFYKVDIGSLEVVDEAYYYMYTYYTNTDDLYRDLSDITVVMGEYGMLINDVTWNIDEDVVENPSTGLFIGIGAVGLTSMLSVGLYFLIKNKKILPRL